jgi:hypothetical protein
VARICHQDDQADCSDSGVDGRMNNSNAEMMINAIRLIRPRTVPFFKKFSVSDYYYSTYSRGRFWREETRKRCQVMTNNGLSIIN